MEEADVLLLGPGAPRARSRRVPIAAGASPWLQEHPRCRVGAGTPRAVGWGSRAVPDRISPGTGTDMAVFCLLCGKRFQTQSALQQHMEVHAGVRSYICSECNRTFPSHTALKRHLRSHTGTGAAARGGRLGWAPALSLKNKGGKER